MPPKIKITKEKILNAAFKIVQEKGYESLNAREIAKKLNCSTQPIFRVYENMNELKIELYKKVDEYQVFYMQNGMEKHEIPFLGMGIAYIEFARDEKNLFKLLFMSDMIVPKNIYEFLEDEHNQSVISIISKMVQIDTEYAKQLYIDLWFVAHGIASLLANNSILLNTKEIENILRDSFMGYKTQFQNKSKRKEDS